MNSSSEDPTVTQDPPPDPSGRPRLQRPSGERAIGGVCAGIARHVGIDPLLVRLGAVALALFGGTGIAVYLIAWVLMPAEGAPARDTRTTVRVGLGITAVVVATGALFVGGFWAAGAGGGTIVALAVIAAGIVLVAGFVKSAARWLLVPALALGIGASTAFAFGVELEGGVGDRSYDPLRVEAIQSEYAMAAGEVDIDLSRVEFPKGDTHTRVQIGMGEARITVPRGVCIAVRGHIGAGEVDLFGDVDDGVDLDLRDEPSAGGTPRLVVDVDMGMGELDVRRSGQRVGDSSPASSASAICEEARNLAG